MNTEKSYLLGLQLFPSSVESICETFPNPVRNIHASTFRFLKEYSFSLILYWAIHMTQRLAISILEYFPS